MRGIANEHKRRALFDYHRVNADILILQEIHSSVECEQIWENEWGGKIIFSHGSTSARGIAILTTKALYQSMSNVYKSVDGRVIILDISECGYIVSIVAIYAPNEDKPAFFQEIAAEIRVRSEHKIIVGDFNLVLDVEMDRENTYQNNNRAMEEVTSIMEEFSLKDIWRIQNIDKREFSWRKPRTYPVKASRIDFALVSSGLDQQVKTVQYLSSLKTDHRAIYLVVELSPSERGCGYWKFNNSLLQNLEFIKTMNKEIEQTMIATQDKKPKDRWELIKKRIKETSVAFARSKISEDKLVISNLAEKVNEYEEHLPLTREENDLYEMTKIELEEKMFDRIKGVMFRSKAKWYEQGEKSTKYFLSLEKARYNAKTCYLMINEKGEEVTTTKDILHEQKKFYSDLYSVDTDVQFSLENTYNIKVPKDIRDNQGTQITIQDLESSMKRMSNNKTPGEDGIPIDFYKVFWTKIKEIFFVMMEQCFEEELLHPSARGGILNLIPKASKDTRYVKNLRPITLLNSDYKLIEKAVADKMIPALQHIIHTDQRGFMKDRRISVNIRKMLDIMHLAEKEDLEAIILSLDFVKCF